MRHPYCHKQTNASQTSGIRIVPCWRKRTRIKGGKTSVPLSQDETSECKRETPVLSWSQADLSERNSNVRNLCLRHKLQQADASQTCDTRIFIRSWLKRTRFKRMTSVLSSQADAREHKQTRALPVIVTSWRKCTQVKYTTLVVLPSQTDAREGKLNVRHP